MSPLPNHPEVVIRERDGVGHDILRMLKHWMSSKLHSYDILVFISSNLLSQISILIFRYSLFDRVLDQALIPILS